MTSKAAAFLAAAALTVACWQASAADCALVPPVRDIATRGVYTDKQGSIQDEAIVQDNKPKLEPIVKFTRRLSEAADRYVLTGRRSDFDCARLMLRSWSEGDALIAGKLSRPAMATRVWTTDSILLSYIKAGALSAPDPAIDSWVKKLADAALTYEADRRRKKVAVANIDYWIASNAAAAGLILHDTKYTDHARTVYRDAINEITDGGYLPNELKRGKRALAYHIFAAAPLLLTARILEFQGEPAMNYRDGRIHLLFSAINRGLSDPTEIEALAGVKQGAQKRPPWWGLYDPSVAAPKARYRLFGGNIEVLRKVLHTL